MHYKIVKYIFKSGRVEYSPFVKKWFGWVAITRNGGTFIERVVCDELERAERLIELHKSGNTKLVKREVV